MALAKRSVRAVPPEGSPLVRTRVPSESRTFHSVRCAVSAEGVSVRGYRSPILPSSAYLSFGHHPPQGIPRASATSSAARSTPDCPPETTFFRRSCSTGYLPPPNLRVPPTTPARVHAPAIAPGKRRMTPCHSGAGYLVDSDSSRLVRVKKWCPMTASVTASPRCPGLRRRVLLMNRQ